MIASGVGKPAQSLASQKLHYLAGSVYVHLCINENTFLLLPGCQWGKGEHVKLPAQQGAEGGNFVLTYWVVQI